MAAIQDDQKHVQIEDELKIIVAWYLGLFLFFL